MIYNRLLLIAVWILLQGTALSTLGHSAPATETLTIGYSSFSGHYVPLWIAVPGWEGASSVDISEAVAAGLCFRPLDETIRDTLAWDLARGGPEPGKEGLAPEREAELLAALAPA